MIRRQGFLDPYLRLLTEVVMQSIMDDQGLKVLLKRWNTK